MQFLQANKLVWLEKLERLVVFKDDCIKMLFGETLGTRLLICVLIQMISIECFDV